MSTASRSSQPAWVDVCRPINLRPGSSISGLATKSSSNSNSVGICVSGDRGSAFLPSPTDQILSSSVMTLPSFGGRTRREPTSAQPRRVRIAYAHANGRLGLLRKPVRNRIERAIKADAGITDELDDRHVDVDGPYLRSSYDLVEHLLVEHLLKDLIRRALEEADRDAA